MNAKYICICTRALTKELAFQSRWCHFSETARRSYAAHTQDPALLHFNACPAPFQCVDAVSNTHYGGARKVGFQHVLEQGFGCCVQGCSGFIQTKQLGLLEQHSCKTNLRRVEPHDGTRYLRALTSCFSPRLQSSPETATVECMSLVSLRPTRWITVLT